MDASRVIEWLNRQIEDAVSRANRHAYSSDGDEREKWLDMIDELVESKHALERAITRGRAPARKKP